mmetsp:Transcript_12554/g.58102  ORF Transcript_12554/g.58102 Transcript_12554/m.58102 type:complete len:207 (+) Transcript_12554:550-1170(+)
MATSSCLAVSLLVYPNLSRRLTNGNFGRKETSIALVIFHPSMIRPSPLLSSTIQLVSLSSRYKKITAWHPALNVMVRALRPSMLLFRRQKPMSFLKASTSNTVWNTLTTLVTASKIGFPSRKIRLSSSPSFSPCVPIARWCSNVRSICSYNCHLNILNGATVSVKLAAATETFSGTWASFRSQNSLTYTVGQYSKVSGWNRMVSRM